ncbi:MAG: hypothetical protein LBF72_03115, partial [Holosporales bacterium]|nr:hypothetical protein [Holosporales bacterium]
MFTYSKSKNRKLFVTECSALAFLALGTCPIAHSTSPFQSLSLHNPTTPSYNCEHYESLSPVDTGLIGFEDILRHSNSAVHLIRHPIIEIACATGSLPLKPPFPATTRILGSFSEKIPFIDENQEQRYFLQRHMCELYDNNKKAFLFYKFNDEYIPLFLLKSENEDSTSITPRNPTIDAVYRLENWDHVSSIDPSSIDLNTYNGITEVPNSTLIGLLWPQPVYQTVANLIGRPSDTITFELDQKGGAKIIGETLFAKIENMLLNQQTINTNITNTKSLFENMPATISEANAQAVSEMLAESKTTIIETVVDEMAKQTASVKDAFTSLAQGVEGHQEEVKQNVTNGFADLTEDVKDLGTQVASLILLANKVELATKGLTAESVAEQNLIQEKFLEIERNINKSFSKYSNQYIATVKHLVSDELQLLNCSILDALSFFQKNTRASIQSCLDQIPLIIREVLLNNEMLLSLSDKIQAVGEDFFVAKDAQITAWNTFSRNFLDTLEERLPTTQTLEANIMATIAANTETLANIEQKIEQSGGTQSTQTDSTKTQILNEIAQSSEDIQTSQQQIMTELINKTTQIMELFERKIEQLSDELNRHTTLIIHGDTSYGTGSSSRVADAEALWQEFGDEAEGMRAACARGMLDPVRLLLPSHSSASPGSIAAVIEAQADLADAQAALAAAQAALTEDVANVKAELKEEISVAKAALEGDIAAANTALTGEITNVKTVLKDGIAASNTALTEEI